MHLFHKWVYNPKIHKGTYLDEPIEWEYDGFRKCSVCGKVQEFNYDSQGGSWDTLTPEKVAIYEHVRGVEATTGGGK